MIIEKENFKKWMNSIDESDTSKREFISDRFSKVFGSIVKFNRQSKDFFVKNEEYASIKKEMKRSDLKLGGILLTGGPSGAVLSIYSFQQISEPVTFDVLNYMVYGSAGLFGGILLTTSYLIFSRTKDKLKEQEKKYKEKTKEMTTKLKENIFLLSPEEIETVEITTKILMENNFLRDFLFTEKDQEGYIINDLSNKSKYNATEMFLNKMWSKEAKLAFLMEFIKENENRYEYLHED